MLSFITSRPGRLSSVLYNGDNFCNLHLQSCIPSPFWKNKKQKTNKQKKKQQKKQKNKQKKNKQKTNKKKNKKKQTNKKKNVYYKR